MAIAYPTETHAVHGYGRLNPGASIASDAVVQCEKCGAFGWLNGGDAGMRNVSDLYIDTEYEETEVLCTDCKHEVEIELI